MFNSFISDDELGRFRQKEGIPVGQRFGEGFAGDNDFDKHTLILALATGGHRITERLREEAKEAGVEPDQKRISEIEIRTSRDLLDLIYGSREE